MSNDTRRTVILVDDHVILDKTLPLNKVIQFRVGRSEVMSVLPGVTVNFKNGELGVTVDRILNTWRQAPIGDANFKFDSRP